jgi:hypothetical protein
VSYCRSKTRHLAATSIDNFLLEHKKIYWWTFTEPGKNDDGSDRTLNTKTQAEQNLRPFIDWLRRHDIPYLVIWELQERLSWHPHVLTAEKRIEVEWLRPWMMERGWGQQMKAVFVRGGGGAELSSLPAGVQVKQAKVRDYLVKSLRRYLLKARTDDALEPRKKFFGGSRGCRVPGTNKWKVPPAVAGNTKWRWNPWIDTAHAMLWSQGRSLFFELHQAQPGWRDMSYVMRLGVEVMDWTSVDFLYEPPWSPSAAPP